MRTVGWPPFLRLGTRSRDDSVYREKMREKNKSVPVTSWGEKC